MADDEWVEPDAFLASAVGAPGERVFHLQVRAGTEVLTVKAKKQQVAALADSLAGLLDDLGGAGTVDPGTFEPTEADWILGAVGVAYDEGSDRILIAAQERTESDHPSTPDASTVRLLISRDQAAGFVALARRLVAAGRPDCVFCGLPIDREGHACPRMN